MGAEPQRTITALDDQARHLCAQSIAKRIRKLPDPMRVNLIAE